MAKSKNAPEFTLGKKPVIKDKAQLAQAVEQISYLEHSNNQIDAECSKAIAPIKSKFENQKTVNIDGDDISLNQYRANLEDAAKDYFANHHDELIKGKSQKLDLTHGEISYKLKAAYLAFLPGHNEKSALAEVLSQAHWARRVIDFLLGLKISNRTANQFLQVTPKLDKKMIVAEHSKKQLTDKNLESYGMTVGGGEKIVTIKPYQYTVTDTSESKSE